MPEPARTPTGELVGEFVGEQGMEGMTEELMRELGFTTQRLEDDASSDSGEPAAAVEAAEPVAAAVEEFASGFVAEPGDDE